MRVAQQCECTSCHWIVQFKMVETVTFLVCVLCITRQLKIKTKHRNKEAHTHTQGILLKWLCHFIGEWVWILVRIGYLKPTVVK